MLRDAWVDDGKRASSAGQVARSRGTGRKIAARFTLPAGAKRGHQFSHILAVREQQLHRLVTGLTFVLIERHFSSFVENNPYAIDGGFVLSNLFTS